jgi:hypothetical protein
MGGEVLKGEKMKNNNNIYITKTKLLKRGWTEDLINKFISEPHDTKPNQMYRSASPIKLYNIDIVELIEDSIEFKEMLQNVEKRRSSSKKAFKTKKEKLLKQVSQININVLILKYSEVLKKAIEHYNERQSDIGNCNMFVNKKSDKSFLQRIQVNYIRHMLTSYDNNLEEIFRRAGVKDAYKVIRNKVFTEIGNAYPYLKQECNRQKQLINIK